MPRPSLGSVLAGTLLALPLIAAPLCAQPAPTVPPSPAAGVRDEAPGDAPMALLRPSPLRGVSARVAALMMSGQQGGAIPIAVLALPVAATAEGTRVFVAADIEGTNLLARQEGSTVQVEVYVYAVTADGSVSGSTAAAFTLGLERAIELLSRGSIKFLASLDVRPGAAAVRVLVRNVQTGSFGIAEAPRVTPAAEGTFAFLSPLLTGEPASAWVVARAQAEDVLWGSAGHPFSFLPGASLPSVRPVLAARSDATLWVLARGAEPGAGTLAVRVLGREAKEVAAFDATVLERRESGLAGARLLRLHLPVPQLPPGPYVLELVAASMTPDVRLVSSTVVMVAEAETVKAQPLWVQFGSPREAADDGAPRERTTFAGRPGRSRVSAKLVAEYRAALAKLPSEPVAAVLAALSELEAAALPTGTAAEWETLVASERQVAEELAGGRPASVLALAYLHFELSGSYAQRKAYLLAAHARRMTEVLAVLYADRAGKAARPAVAGLLAGLAGGLQQPGMSGGMERLFRRALQFDPANRAALMGLAAGLERIGQYRLAAESFSRLVELDAADAEARLRLGVNLGRLGEDAKSAEVLKACTTTASPRWVRVVAYQELAAALIRSGRFAQAHRILTEAVAAVPGDEALAISLAYVLDRLHRPIDARTVADGVRAARRDDGDSPRYRYSEWPTGELERSHAAVAEAGRTAIAELAEALAAPKGGGRP
jgi:Flp pilus assembly protein TadD